MIFCVSFTIRLVVQEDVRLGPLPNPHELGSPKEDLEELKRRIYGDTSTTTTTSSQDVVGGYRYRLIS